MFGRFLGGGSLKSDDFFVISSARRARSGSVQHLDSLLTKLNAFRISELNCLQGNFTPVCNFVMLQKQRLKEIILIGVRQDYPEVSSFTCFEPCMYVISAVIIKPRVIYSRGLSFAQSGNYQQRSKLTQQ
jgi:hypothetical protein